MNGEETTNHHRRGGNGTQSPLPPHYRSNDNTLMRISLGPALISGISRFSTLPNERLEPDTLQDRYTSLPSRRRAGRERHGHERAASKALPDSLLSCELAERQSKSGFDELDELPPSFQPEGLLADDPNVVVLGLNELQERLQENSGDLEKGLCPSGPVWTWEAQSHVFSVIRRPRRVLRRDARLCIVKHRVGMYRFDLPRSVW
jgi:hypothetical protein